MDEAHPIPQNVTSFEFHLVGDMTLKQFGYLVAGLFPAYLTFAIFFRIVPLIAGPFILLFALLGAAYAFVPILDRPLDHWTKAFFKAIYSPTRGKWKSPFDSNLTTDSNDPIFKDRLKSYLAILSSQQPQITQENNSALAMSAEETARISAPEIEPVAPEKPAQSSSLKLTKEEETLPHPVQPISKPNLPPPVPTLKPLKVNPTNLAQSQTIQSIKQDLTQNKLKPPLNQLSQHQPFVPSSHLFSVKTSSLKKEDSSANTNLSAFADSELDFSPQHNPALQHLQFMYNHPPFPQPRHPSPNHNPWPVIPPKPHTPTPSVKPVMPPSPLPKVEPIPKFQTSPIPAVPLPPPPLPPVKPSTTAAATQQAVNQSKSSILPSSTPNGGQEKLPTSEELNRLVELAKEAQLLQNKIEEAEKHIKEITASAVSSPEYKDKFSQVYSNLQDLINKTDSLGKQAAETHKVIPPPITKSTSVKVVEPPKPQTSQPVLTSQPNVINGIVTDPKGSFIEGVIIIIHDKDGLPVRALKTNKIGQFTGTTPLPAGVYTITLEKEGLEFDTLEVNLNGDVLPPLQISAKGGGPIAHA